MSTSENINVLKQLEKESYRNQRQINIKVINVLEVGTLINRKEKPFRDITKSFFEVMNEYMYR